MKHREFKVPGISGPVTIFHNEDWSGFAVIEWMSESNVLRTVEIPASILLQLSFVETKRFVLAELEHALDERLAQQQQPTKPRKGKR